MDREVKECLRLAEAAVDHLRGRGHSPYTVGLINKIIKELLVLEEALIKEDEHD